MLSVDWSNWDELNLKGFERALISILQHEMKWNLNYVETHEIAFCSTVGIAFGCQACNKKKIVKQIAIIFFFYLFTYIVHIFVSMLH